jgi:Uncharacterized protein conserved in bacteria
VASKSRLEEKFFTKWKELYPKIDFEREYKLLENRNFRADFAHPDSKTAIEIQGGIWISGRHNRGSGYTKDCKRTLALIAQGWTVIYLVESMFTQDTFEKIKGIIDGGDNHRGSGRDQLSTRKETS